LVNKVAKIGLNLLVIATHNARVAALISPEINDQIGF